MFRDIVEHKKGKITDMPDIPYKVPGTGETRYKHITSGQQRLMAKMNWDRAVARARAEKLKKEKDSESSDKEQPCIEN